MYIFTHNMAELDILGVLEGGMSTYCENGIGLFYTQPVNTISNIVIFVSAYFSYQLVRTYRIKNLIIRILPLIIVLAAIGSILWHGIPNLLTSFADLVPLSAFVLVSFFFLLDKCLPNKSLVWGSLFAFVLIQFPFIFGIFPSFNGLLPYSIVLIFGLFALFGLARRYKALVSQLIFVLLIFIIALFFRTIDHTICSRLSIGTHSLWHILNALVFYLSVRFFVKLERKEQES